jgi:thymidylate synthase
MQSFLNESAQWFEPFWYLAKNGKLIHPKGVKTLEIENYQIELNPQWNLCKYTARKISTRYLVGELAWYLNGSRNNDFITHYSKFWNKVKNDAQPLFNSNYGYYAFVEGQMHKAIQALRTDKASRQAVIIISSVAALDARDVPCTYSVSFRIRDNKLNMSVSMRSNDIWMGFCIDMFQFSIWQQMVYNGLLIMYPDLELGTYTHKADSFHVYEKDFDAMEDLVSKHIWDDTIETPPLLEPWDYAFGTEILLTAEAGIRTNGYTDFKVTQPGFTSWAIQQLIKQTDNGL